jgi:hypothetical protein
MKYIYTLFLLFSVNLFAVASSSINISTTVLSEERIPVQVVEKNMNVLDINNTLVRPDIKDIPNYHKYKQDELQKLIDQLCALSPAQRNVLYNSLNYVTKSGYILAGIAWRESNFVQQTSYYGNAGKLQYKGSYGPYQALLDTVLKEHVEKNANPKIVRKLLLNNIGFANKIACRELDTWAKILQVKMKRKKRITNFDRELIASYNVGWRGTTSTMARDYADDVLKKTNVINGFFKVNKKIGI